MFPGPEVSIIEDVIDRLWELDADAVSDLSHSAPGWRITPLKQEIPYYTALLSPIPEQPSANAMRFGRELATARRKAV
jgi:hypothetical protein